MRWLLVACGGFLGAIARYGMTVAIAPGYWPSATLATNLAGCFVIGAFLTLLGEHRIADDRWRLFVAVGFVGAFTTFSTYEHETLQLLSSGRVAAALSYVAVSTVGGFGAVAAGVWLARRIDR